MWAASEAIVGKSNAAVAGSCTAKALATALRSSTAPSESNPACGVVPDYNCNHNFGNTHANKVVKAITDTSELDTSMKG